MVARVLGTLLTLVVLEMALSCGSAEDTGSPWGPVTANGGCQVRGPLPDSRCTPGAVLLGVNLRAICTPGFAGTKRAVSTSTRDQVARAYGVNRRAADYEIDHLIPLELGGSNDVANLWPEAASPAPGYHEKDQFENYLHQQVCSGKLDLKVARDQIARDWVSAWEAAGKP